MSIILIVYLVIQILILSSIMIMEIQLIPHAITMTISCIAYFIVAFKNPGYYVGQQKQAPSLDDQIQNQNRVPRDQKIIKEMDDEEDANQKSLINEDKNQNQIKTSINGQNLNSPHADSMINKNQNQAKIQQKLIKTKFPTISPHNQQKLKQIKSSQIDFFLNKNSSQVHRYCRICKTFQPYRVRHCNQCQKCICTFDHHCPWMDNCIGQKNRNVFWTYLLLQFIEFFLVLIDVAKKAFSSKQDKAKFCFFALSVLFVTIVAFCLLVFHTYLMLKNFTTWEYIRWDRINYLSIYNYKKSSPFSFGFVRNISDYFFPGKIPKQWIINPQFIQFNNKCNIILKPNLKQKQIPLKPKQKTKIIQKAQTERAIISTHRR